MPINCDTKIQVTLAACALILAPLANGVPGRAADDVDTPSIYSVLPHPAISLSAPITPTLAEKLEIRDLINRLSETKSFDVGYSNTMTGRGFAPIPSSKRFSSGLLTNHNLRAAEPFTRLVSLGPKAMSLLLEHLDDKAPTQLTIDLKRFDGVWFDREMGANGANKAEIRVLKARKPSESFGLGNTTRTPSYTIRVGDLCFVALGQITNRMYSAVRYQPTMCLVINSPVQDPALAVDVRTIWESDDSGRKLFESLLLDYYTLVTSKYSTHPERDLQAEAARRLIYYFPTETAPLITADLKRLDVIHSDWDKRMRANQVRDDDFIEALNWTDQPGISEEMRSILRRTKVIPDLLAAMPALGKADDAVVLKTLKDVLAALPADEAGPYGNGYNLLRAMRERFPAQAVPAYRRYLKNASPQRVHTICVLLATFQKEQVSPLLGPFLKDRRRLPGYTYPAKPLSPKPMRVCDQVAETFAAAGLGLTFDMRGTYENLDRQIEVIRKHTSRGVH